ncbi:MAG: hypothetical protein VXY81_15150, partial [Pseudomonadota bacterium]|nr:hypothetical protein [Pseudomonadota bacterium]
MLSIDVDHRARTVRAARVAAAAFAAFSSAEACFKRAALRRWLHTVRAERHLALARRAAARALHSRLARGFSTWAAMYSAWRAQRALKVGVLHLRRGLLRRWK